MIPHAEMSFFCKCQNFYRLTIELLHDNDGFNMYFRLIALEDVNITYENNDFVNLNMFCVSFFKCNSSEQNCKEFKISEHVLTIT
jgi:hypothetical protein